ncbi:MAG: hypothetical protein LT071_10220 [Nocardioides sp.]|nr:hypothetical protein [Nocardioides sp.]
MTANAAWRLEDFVDSLVVELDKTRETLAVKAINKKLTYSVKEVALDVNAFPTYDGDQVRFTTARPGEEGASRLTIQLGSVTDQQVRASSKPVEGTAPSPSIDELDVDPTTRSKLRRIGVSSVDDLQALEERKVNLKQATDSALDYTELARKIRKARRSNEAPRLEGMSIATSAGRPCLLMEGRNLSVDPTFPPVAVLNGRLVEVLSSGPGHLELLVDPEHPLRADNEVVVTFDPYAVVRVNVKA